MIKSTTSTLAGPLQGLIQISLTVATIWITSSLTWTGSRINSFPKPILEGNKHRGTMLDSSNTLETQEGSNQFKTRLWLEHSSSTKGLQTKMTTRNTTKKDSFSSAGCAISLQSTRQTTTSAEMRSVPATRRKISSISSSTATSLVATVWKN